jgi:hypothetical protein
MAEYRKNRGPVETPEARGGSGADLEAGKMEKYYSLTGEYTLDDNMVIGGLEGDEQTIEQEYQAYITAPLSSKTVDILRFWEVGNFFLMIFQYY